MNVTKANLEKFATKEDLEKLKDELYKEIKITQKENKSNAMDRWTSHSRHIHATCHRFISASVFVNKTKKFLCVVVVCRSATSAYVDYTAQLGRGMAYLKHGKYIDSRKFPPLNLTLKNISCFLAKVSFA